MAQGTGKTDKLFLMLYINISMHSHINFGYPWWLTYGHLLLGCITGLLLLLASRFRVAKWRLAILGIITFWALSSFLVVRFIFDVNGRARMPTQSFLASGSGKILDIGAGTGRSTLMVLEARPQTTVVALDSFSDSYVKHFGNQKPQEEIPDQGRERLLESLRIARVDSRATVVAADMRQMPFPPETFDGIVTAYVVDHLRHDEIGQALTEARRVLKPRGEFLLIVTGGDFWMLYSFGPLLIHSKGVPADFWPNNVRDAGFEIMEDGFAPFSRYVLARRP
jgi:SAM-dependent methyltransferase